MSNRFANFVRNAIFEEEKKTETGKVPQATVDPEKVETQSFHLSAGEAATGTTPAPQSSGGVGEIDEGILEKLEEKLSQEDIPGPDYLELKQAAMDEDSVKDEPDERKRYRQAFANMKRFFPKAGVDKARILSAIDHYKKVMEAEGKDAEEDLKRKIQEQVVAFRNKITADEEELNRRQAQLDEDRRSLESRKKTVAEREASLNQKSKNFLKTLNFLIGILDSDRKKLEEYLDD